ncbi:ninja-family protein AFP3-like protein [Tanacetum coccineum]
MKKDSLLDLLQTLNSNTIPLNPNPVNNKNHHPDTTLALSLNGKYGWDPQSNKLSRACSSSLIPELVDVELSLSRTCSLVDEVEWRKRKEMQMLRRSEVKRRRLDQKMKKKKKQSSPPLPEKLVVRFSSDGSSQGSSGLSYFDTQPSSSSGTNRDTGGTNEPFSINKVQGNPKSTTNEPAKTNKVQGNPKIKPNAHCVIDQTMPCVSTKEEGPDGKRIQGFLYRYGKGEEVRIVCVCHGNFLTPAEFVKHGGGGNVEHPLRHIIVTPLFS